MNLKQTKYAAIFLGGILVPLLFPLDVLCAERTVSVFSDDESAEGTLRKILQVACDDAGNDTIHFADFGYSSARILLDAPLVIPEDCRGTVTVKGPADIDIILDAGNLGAGGSTPGDSCILHVYSDGHVIRNLSFVNNSKGAGVCLFGRDNTVKENRFGATEAGDEEPNRYGIVVSDVFVEDYPEIDGSGNTIRGNTIGPNDRQGIWVEASDVLIGGDSFDDDRNVIQENEEGGIFVVGKETNAVHITHNTISNNGEEGLGIDLNDDGISLNDLLDSDTGPDEMMNFLDHLQLFPLVPDPSGTARYWGWGVALSGTHLELYRVSDEDWKNEVGYGGGDDFVADFSLSGYAFETDPEIDVFSAGDIVTALVFDGENNTSEFSMNIPVGDDADLDGIVDDDEAGGTSGSLADDADSDDDGLPDPAEDHNRNGVWDEDLGETSAWLADSDEDGLSDWYEIHGDGVYDEGVDTDPLNNDTDGDGLLDGQEDANLNGVWESYLGETSPLLSDSDQDGVDDSADNCPAVSNPDQEDWYCQL
ncbi:MAG: right-handed parallel beta-helix repeat-containing protein [Deltaproteobacteria bacterium]|nr:right-handed parallel beta-helix repeat-containing protein [Deltaproteobacteria bacterium]